MRNQRRGWTRALEHGVGQLPAITALLGVTIRIWQWSQDQSLWLDEALLGNSVVTRDLRQLLVVPLDRAQSVPTAFLLTIEGMAGLFGTSDQSLRLVPLVIGILGVMASVWVARELFETIVARVTFVAVMAVSPSLLYYATELKPYGTDVLATLVVVGLLSRHDGSPESLRWLLLAGVLIPWFSLPGALVVVIAAGIALIDAPARARTQHLRVGALIAASAGLAAVNGARLAPSGTAARELWRDGFPGLTADLPVWLIDTVLAVVHLSFRHVGAAGARSDPAARSLPTAVIAVAVIVGLWLIGRHRPRIRMLAALTAAMVVVGAIAGVYPARGRLLLFLVPLCAIGVAAVVEWAQRLTVPVQMAALLAVVAVMAVALARHPIPRGDVEAALEHVKSRAMPGDILVPSAWSEPAFEFYERSEKTGLAVPGVLVSADHDPSHFWTHVGPLVTNRVWLLFTHRLEDAEPLLVSLSDDARLVSSYEDSDLGLYLFRLEDARDRSR